MHIPFCYFTVRDKERVEWGAYAYWLNVQQGIEIGYRTNEGVCLTKTTV